MEEGRVGNLKRIINGRPVAIIVHGPSVVNLEQRISELRNYDICYMSLNRFDLIEGTILNKIDKKLSAILVSAPEEFPFRFRDIVNFLERKEDNFYITVLSTLDIVPTARNYLLSKYNKKLLFLEIIPYANSLLGLIQVAMIAGSANIFLFGVDGSLDKLGEYYKPEIMNEEQDVRGEHLADDTIYFNKIMPTVVQDLKKMGVESNILNVSEGSLITTFKKSSYDEAFKRIGELG